MNIGIFTDCYRPSFNGVTTSIDTFKKELEKRGHKVYIFCPFVEGCVPEPNIFRLPAFDEITPENYPPVGVPIIPMINRTIKPLKLDVIHSHTPFLVANLGHRASVKLNLPEVHTYHTHLTEYSHYVPTKFIQPMVKKGLKYLAKTICNRSDIVIAPSTAMKNLLLSYSIKTPIVVNPTGIDSDEFKNINVREKKELLKRYQIPADRKIILFAGRLAKEKNLDFLLQCFVKVKKEIKHSFLIFAGGGPSEDELNGIIKKLNLTADARITGFLEKGTMIDYYNLADVFAFPSVTETQGIVLLEAMTAGVPVVAIDKLGPKDIVSDGQDGYLSELSIEDFSQNIVKILNNGDLREKMSNHAREKATKFSVEVTTDRLLEIYNMAIEARKVKPKKGLRNRIFKLINAISPF